MRERWPVVSLVFLMVMLITKCRFGGGDDDGDGNRKLIV